MSDYLEKANRWKNSNKLNKELKEELDNLTPEQLYDAFYTDLEFGTGGMRGIMGVGTNRLNVIIITKVTLGFARYLLKDDENAKEKGVVIAHDNRLHNKDFTMAAANVLTSLGIKVYIFDDLRTTPELSFAIRYLHACGGINITASHNPKEYNGYKIYNSDGCQLILEQSNKVLKEIAQIKDELNIDINPRPKLIKVLSDEVDEAYYDMVISTSVNKKMDKSNIKIVYTPQHGTGYIPVTTVLKRLGYNVIEVQEQCFPSNTFENTLSPNPEEKDAYKLAIEYAKREHADLICTNDPDCDRCGIAVLDKNGEPRFFTGNQTAAMLIDYYFNAKKQEGTLPKNGVMYNTIVTSPLGAKVAASYGIDTETTLTGFKYIGDKIAKSIENNGKEFVMGYEESYGYLFNSNVRDKDGVQSIMLICEMTSYYAHKGLTLIDVYENIQQRLNFFVDTQYSYKAPGAEGVSKIASIMDNLRNADLSLIANEKVKAKEDYLSLTRIENGKEKHLDYEQSNVLRYIFEDDCFVAIRPSGTEPKCKFYFSISDKTKAEAEARHDRIRNFILDLIK